MEIKITPNEYDQVIVLRGKLKKKYVKEVPDEEYVPNQGGSKTKIIGTQKVKSELLSKFGTQKMKDFRTISFLKKVFHYDDSKEDTVRQILLDEVAEQPRTTIESIALSIEKYKGMDHNDFITSGLAAARLLIKKEVLTCTDTKVTKDSCLEVNAKAIPVLWDFNIAFPQVATN